MTNKIAQPTPSTKDTIYVDTEDEITAVIEKVTSSDHRIVAVVLPKHATVFQSVVNMKLLQRASTNASKNLVLVTSDKAVLPIASTAGILVAKTPSSKPEVPVINIPDNKQANSDEAITEATAAASSAAIASNVEDAEEPIALDGPDDEVEDTTVATTQAGKALKKAKKVKKSGAKVLKIPDFSSFRTRLGLGLAALVALVVLWIFGFVILPKATVTLNTDTSSAPVNTVVRAQVGTVELNLEENIIPAEREQIEKIDKVTVDATGEKNIGQKATGRINLENCINKEGKQIVPAGTRFSAGSIAFETIEQVTLPEASFILGNCRTSERGDDKTVDVIAIDSGESYNVGAQNYNSSISGINANGSSMKGGTTENITVISQSDIDNATSQLSGSSKAEALTELKATLSSKKLRVIEESLQSSEPKVVSTPAVGDEASQVEVTSTVNYSLLGVSDDDLKSVLDKEILASLEEKEKNIRNNGFDSVTFQQIEVPDEATQVFTLETVASIGPDLDQEKLKQEVVGKRRGEIEKQLEAIDGVRSVSVDYSPAWITTTPKSVDKIEIVLNEDDE